MNGIGHQNFDHNSAIRAGTWDHKDTVMNLLKLHEHYNNVLRLE